MNKIIEVIDGPHAGRKGVYMGLDEHNPNFVWFRIISGGPKGEFSSEPIERIRECEPPIK